MLGKIEVIEDVHGFGLGNAASMDGRGGSLGIDGMIKSIFGGRSMEGFKIKTTEHTILVLIDDGQSCCENAGFFATEDDFSEFIGSELFEMNFTDTELRAGVLKSQGFEYESEHGFDGGGIQFVTFKTSSGDFQLAVYNSHNGYYGHGIIVAQDEKILLDDTL